ncbi:unnamed protein product [Orchesella dallaii]|uniref:Chromo domain-containing protein n=1 Tax=Orchesella dallaii TaxID=48710 RepID=A0ABP1PN29_9HEXA
MARSKRRPKPKRSKCKLTMYRYKTYKQGALEKRLLKKCVRRRGIRFYRVIKILGYRFNGRHKQYYVKWSRYTSRWNTYQPQSSFPEGRENPALKEFNRTLDKQTEYAATRTKAEIKRANEAKSEVKRARRARQLGYIGGAS